MNFTKLMPFLEDGSPKKLQKTAPPTSNFNDNFRLNYTESQGHRRNHYIKDTRAIASVSRTCQNIKTSVVENTVSNKVDINFIKLERSKGLTPEEREYIKEKWYKYEYKYRLIINKISKRYSTKNRTIKRGSKHTS